MAHLRQPLNIILSKCTQAFACTSTIGAPSTSRCGRCSDGHVVSLYRDFRHQTRRQLSGFEQQLWWIGSNDWTWLADWDSHTSTLQWKSHPSISSNVDLIYSIWLNTTQSPTAVLVACQWSTHCGDLCAQIYRLNQTCNTSTATLIDSGTINWGIQISILKQEHAVHVMSCRGMCSFEASAFPSRG